MELIHVILYAKGWYKRTENIWPDLKKILELDNYTPFDKRDVFQIISGHIMRYILDNNTEMSGDYKLRTFLEGINPHECWRTNYFTKDITWAINENKEPYTNEYDYYEAYVRSALSLWSCSSRKDLGWTDDFDPKTIVNKQYCLELETI